MARHARDSVAPMRRSSAGSMPATRRAELNEREAPDKVVTARPPKHFAQLRSVSHALVSTLLSTSQNCQN